MFRLSSPVTRGRALRIVKGKLAGRALVSPGARVRPTTEEVRDGWLTLLEPELPGAVVLDLFAGSGALGLEALSRGAAKADFVEDGPAALHSLKANVAALRVRKRTRLFKKDAIPFVEALAEGTYDIAFADPPYGSKKLERVVNRWLDVPFARILCVEHSKDFNPRGGGRHHRFGDTTVTIFRKKEPAAPTTRSL